MLKNKTGDCFEANFLAVFNMWNETKNKRLLKEIRLCHGIMTGAPGSKIENQKGWHCWIETQDVVFDYSNGNAIVGRKEEVYYRILEQTIMKYTIVDAMKLCHKTGHYGEWHKIDEKLQKEIESTEEWQKVNAGGEIKLNN